MLATSRIIAFAPTADPVRARAFYEGTLGLSFIKDDGFALVFDSNGIMLRVAKGREVTPAQYTILGWEAVAWFKDPDGNILSISQHV